VIILLIDLIPVMCGLVVVGMAAGELL